MSEAFKKRMAAASVEQLFTVLDGRCEIMRRHNKGWPFIRSHFIYRVTADKATLMGLCLCEESWFPVGRKRTSHAPEDGWALKAVRGSRWRVTFWEGAVERQRRVEIFIHHCQTIALCDARNDRAFQTFLAGVIG